MDAKHEELIRRGIDEYLSHFDDPDLTPVHHYLPYDFDEVDGRRWVAFGAGLAKSELQAMTNIMNGWLSSLLRWCAWNRALADFEMQDAWELRIEFVEACAHHCLLQPSAIRDALTYVAINVLHQVKLSLGNGYKDALPGDPKVAGKKQNFLSRPAKEQCIENLIDTLPSASQFLTLLRSVDDDQYRSSTLDYRNRSSHAIGPRLGVGITQFVSRSVVPSTKLEKQPDGTSQLIEVPGSMNVRYTLGGTPPLDMEGARIANVEQFQRARDCFICFRGLLREAISSLPKAT